MNIILLRHGVTLTSDEFQYGRMHNAPLNSEQFYLLEDTRKKLFPIGSNWKIYSSPSKRCIDTLFFVLGKRINFNILYNLTTYYSGKFENLTIREMKSKHADYMNLSYSQKFLDPKFGEESIYEQTKRVSIEFQNLLEECDDNSYILLCSHYSVINILMSIFHDNYEISKYSTGKYQILEGKYYHVEIDHALLSKQVYRVSSLFAHDKLVPNT